MSSEKVKTLVDSLKRQAEAAGLDGLRIDTIPSEFSPRLRVSVERSSAEVVLVCIPYNQLGHVHNRLRVSCRDISVAELQVEFADKLLLLVVFDNDGQPLYYYLVRFCLIETKRWHIRANERRLYIIYGANEWEHLLEHYIGQESSPGLVETDAHPFLAEALYNTIEGVSK